MNHVVSVSSGLSSALVLERVCLRYDPAAVVGVFMDTTIEDEDNYRFLQACESRWSARYGVQVIHLQEGRTPYEVAEDKQIIPNQKIAPCTFALKIDLFRDWLTDRFEPGAATIHIGYDYTEVHRIPATERNYRAAGYPVDFPLLWKPYEFRDYSQVVREDWGIEPPRTYPMGFTHGNCLKKGCVRMSLADWRRFWIYFPERYAETEAWEQEQRQHPTREDYALLRDQSNGTVTPLTLKAFRERLEQEDGGQLSFDFEGCVHCGVGDLM